MYPQETTLTTFDTKTKLVKQIAKNGTISYHVITYLENKQHDHLPILKGFGHVARLEIISYATGLDLFKIIKDDHPNDQ